MMDMEQFKIELGQRIKSQRIYCRMTQEELAQKLGYSDNGKGMISKIENGKVEPPLSKMFSIADALHTSVVYLMGWDRDIAIAQPEKTYARTWMTEQETMLISMFRMLNDDGKTAAVTMINGMTLNNTYLRKSEDL